MTSLFGKQQPIDSIITNPGDIVTRRTAGDLVRVPVGSNGTVLTVDTTQTTDLNWISNANGNVTGPGSSVTNTVPVFADTTGLLLADSTVSINAGAITAPGAVATAGLTLNGATSGNVTINPAGTITTYSVTYPSAQGAANSVMQNNGSGVLSWTVPGSNAIGNVIGPGSSTANGVATYSNTGGKTLLSTPLTIDSTGNLTVPSAKFITFSGGSSNDSLTMNYFVNGSTNAGVRFASAPNGTDQSALQVGSVQLNILKLQNSGFTGGNYILTDKGVGLGLQGSSSGKLSIQPPTTITPYSLTMPTAQGEANQTMINNGSGALSWTTIATFSTSTITDSNGVGPSITFTIKDDGTTLTYYWQGSGAFSAGATDYAKYLIPGTFTTKMSVFQKLPMVNGASIVEGSVEITSAPSNPYIVFFPGAYNSLASVATFTSGNTCSWNAGSLTFLK